MFPKDFIDAFNRNTLTGVSAGEGRATALPIWVVAVGDRLFARSWGLSERSWFATFSKGERGFLESESHRVAVKGQVPTDLELITPLINAEYLRKYNHGDNALYAQGIVAEKHVQHTMEFIPIND
jgi:hypothetical protein